MNTLRADDEAPWASETFPLTAHRLGRLLAPFEIGSRQMRIGAKNIKGYERATFVDAWERYLPPAPSPLEAKHRNTEPDRCFDVAVPSPTDGGDATEPPELPVDEEYPRSAWDPESEGDRRQTDLWSGLPGAGPSDGASA